MPQANALRVGPLMGGALVIQPSRLVVVASTARLRRVQERGWRQVREGWSRCWVLRERAPVGVLVVFRRLGSCLPGWWVGSGRAGRFCLPYRIWLRRPLFGGGLFGVVGVGGGCGAGSVRVLRTA